MKKILIASTALVATAGMAAAEVSFGGFGRFGLFYQENATGDNETRIEQRFRLTVTGTTETDAGVKFEGRIRFQTDEDGDGTGSIARNSAAGFAVSTGGLRLDVGHVSDVIDSGDVVNYYGFGVGLTSSIEQSSGFGLPASGFGTGFNLSDTDADGQFDTETGVNPTVKLRYQIGDFTASASYTDDNDTDLDEYQVGVGYKFNNFSAGAAYGQQEGAVTDNDFWAVSFGGAFGPVDFVVLIADQDADGNDVRYGASAEYDISAATAIRFVLADNGADDDSEVYGIGFTHSLGGGVSLKGGVGSVGDNTIADFGAQFDF